MPPSTERTNLFFKVEIEHDPDERPERLGEELRRVLLKFYGVRRVELTHLARDARLEPRRVEARDRTDAAPAGEDAFPRLRDGRPEGRDHADAGDDDASALAVPHGP